MPRLIDAQPSDCPILSIVGSGPCHLRILLPLDRQGLGDERRPEKVGVEPVLSSMLCGEVILAGGAIGFIGCVGGFYWK